MIVIKNISAGLFNIKYFIVNKRAVILGDFIDTTYLNLKYIHGDINVFYL